MLQATFGTPTSRPTRMWFVIAALISVAAIVGFWATEAGANTLKPTTPGQATTPLSASTSSFTARWADSFFETGRKCEKL